MEEHGVEVCGGRLGVVLVHQSGDVVESNCSALKKKSKARERHQQQSDTSIDNTLWFKQTHTYTRRVSPPARTHAHATQAYEWSDLEVDRGVLEASI